MNEDTPFQVGDVVRAKSDLNKFLWTVESISKQGVVMIRWNGKEYVHGASLISELELVKES